MEHVQSAEYRVQNTEYVQSAEYRVQTAECRVQTVQRSWPCQTHAALFGKTNSIPKQNGKLVMAAFGVAMQHALSVQLLD